MSDSAADAARDRTDRFSREEMQSVVEFLAHDLMEGRAPGTRGGRLTELYVQSVFKLMGLRPGVNGGYLQPFELAGFTTRDLAVSVLGAEVAGSGHVIGAYTGDEAAFTLEGEAVFIGFGIRTPIFDWDDLKSADLRGKVVIVRASDPGHWDRSLFEGGTLTYFGRSLAKFEAAQRAGARAVLLIHTVDSTGADWGLLQRSWETENVFLPSSLAGSLEFRGVIREESLRRLLAARGLDLETLYEGTLTREFVPVPLGFPMAIAGRNESRRIEAANVVAEIPGRSDRRIVLSAHIDHIGQVPGQAEGGVYNGAIDNGSAVAALVLCARALNEVRETLPHTITLLACGAEEGGLLGSTYFVQRADRKSILACVNFESTPVWGRSNGIMAVGARFSTLGDLIQGIARDEGLSCSEGSMAEQGFFYRSDQFPFARYGIPAVWLSAGEEFASGVNHLKEFFSTTYHTVRDDFDPTWELEALRQTVRLAVMLVERIGRSPEPPRWKSRLAFPTEER